jgi:Putative beta barrel porin-7 (BBP7)
LRQVQLSGGYQFFLWDGVLRSGDQIDTVVNTTSKTPTTPFKEDVFWAQGLNVGVTFSW